jgi:hypothetical protein
MKKNYPNKDTSPDCPQCYGLGLITIYYTGGIVTVPCEACAKKEAEDRKPTADLDLAASKRKSKRPKSKVRRA